jgi:hypothetical protein
MVQFAVCSVQGVKFKVQGSGCRMLCAVCSLQCEKVRVQSAGCITQGVGCRVQGAGCRVKGLGVGSRRFECGVSGAGSTGVPRPPLLSITVGP